MPSSIRPGDVLAGRYLLVDLLSESGNGRFWRAHDRTLDRKVSVHVISSGDERADGMVAAARRSAAVLDRRILRVLDVEARGDLCYVVNEWGSGTSLDILVPRDGPISPRRAAWIVSEVAGSIAVAHDAGVAHGRLVPENVLIDESGSVRVIGFSVDAALMGLPPGRMSSDVTDLAGLLYFLLTGKWPGVSRSDVPSAPQVGGRVLRPRQVRAGVPRVLDTLCDEVLNAHASAGSGEYADAHAITAALREFVGDPTGMAAAEAAAGRRNGFHPPETTRLMPTLPPPRTPAPGGPEPAAAPEAGEEPETEVGAPPTPPSGPADQPTEAGMPIFDDGSDDVSWLRARSEPPPPPPPFEEPPERPLFAPEPPDGRPARTPRPGVTPTPAPAYWPWEGSTGTGAPVTTGSGIIPIPEDDEEDPGVPGRSWLRLAGVVGACTLLLLAVIVAFNLGRGRTPLGTVPDDEQPSSTPSAERSPAATLLTGLTASDFDPQGDPPDENPELAPLVLDGDPATTWRTETYLQNLGPAGLKTGVGLAFDLDGRQRVSSVDLTMVGAPTSVSVYVSDEPPTRVKGLQPAATGVVEGDRARITLDEPATGRHLVVWLTSLPTVDGGFRGEVAEVAVRG